MTDDNSNVTSTDQEMEHIGILSIDPGLEQHQDHFEYRVRRYLDQKSLIQKYEGGLEEFARGDFSSSSMPVYLFSFLFGSHIYIKSNFTPM